MEDKSELGKKRWEYRTDVDGDLDDAAALRVLHQEISREGLHRRQDRHRVQEGKTQIYVSIKRP